MQAIGVGNAHNFLWFCIIAKKARARGEEMKTCRGSDVLRDNELKLEDVEASHTLCGAGMVRRKLRVRERASERASQSPEFSQHAAAVLRAGVALKPERAGPRHTSAACQLISKGLKWPCCAEHTLNARFRRSGLEDAAWRWSRGRIRR